MARHGYTLLLSAPHFDDAREPDILNTLLERGVDAVAWLGTAQPRLLIARLEEQRKPFVLMWEHECRYGHTVGFDEFSAGELVVEHLWGLGHRRIGMISGITVGRPRSARRKAGVARALRARGAELAADAVVEVEHGFREGYEAMQAMLARPSHLRGVTAIVCAADYLAAGALSALDRAGIAVPAQMSVVSFNDNDFSAYLHPPLTTVHLPIREIGERAGRYLIESLSGASPARPPILRVELVVRQSSGRAPKSSLHGRRARH